MMTCNTMPSTVPEGFDGHTRLLARFVSTLNYDELPREVVEHAKICVLDALGSILLGATMPWGKIMIEYVRSVAGKPESIVVGSHVSAGAGHAALANSPVSQPKRCPASSQRRAALLNPPPLSSRMKTSAPATPASTIWARKTSRSLATPAWR